MSEIISLLFWPYQNIGKVGAVAYKLQSPVGATVHPVFYERNQLVLSIDKWASEATKLLQNRRLLGGTLSQKMLLGRLYPHCRLKFQISSLRTRMH
ncbi:hypothetical protein EPI10_005996 [Gossypium australe]|uniref:Uncharacterized protein n=1 Tax=Gossypium australe TaxID=47621 RepID=A0A5B6WPP9_9ROSI|nr:hypothetical protein EPI10_005996 [Gossypium australe]